jgi:hypothetical protein
MNTRYCLAPEGDPGGSEEKPPGLAKPGVSGGDGLAKSLLN